jgi:hypothetical protein
VTSNASQAREWSLAIAVKTRARASRLLLQPRADIGVRVACPMEARRVRPLACGGALAKNAEGNDVAGIASPR